jgi:branched-chain amino acid transport system substrate-binding protein
MNKWIMKWGAVGVGLALAGASLVTLVGTTPSSASNSPYVVGAVTSLSGGLASIGEALSSGSKAYFNYVNAHGGVDGHKIDFVPLDDQSGVTTAALSDVADLVQQHHAVTSIDWILTNVESAAQAYSGRYDFSMLTQGCDPSVSSPSHKVTFCVGMAENYEDQPEVNFAATLVPKGSTPKVAILDLDSLAQETLGGRVAKDVIEKGWDVVTNQLVSLTSTDLTAQAQEIVSSGATIVIASLDAAHEQLFDQALRSLGSTVPVIDFDGGASLGLAQQLADPNLYMLSGFTFPDTTTAAMKLYESNIAKVKVSAGTAFALNGYVEAYVTVKALKKCGSNCTAAGFTKAMQKLGTFGTEGLTVEPLKYSTKDFLGIQGGVFYGYDATTKTVKVESSILPLAKS